MITSRNTRDASAVSITQPDFIEGGLPHDSNIRPNRLFTADGRIILRTAGKLSEDKMQAVVAEIVRIVSNGNAAKSP